MQNCCSGTTLTSIWRLLFEGLVMLSFYDNILPYMFQTYFETVWFNSDHTQGNQAFQTMMKNSKKKVTPGMKIKTFEDKQF